MLHLKTVYVCLSVSERERPICEEIEPILWKHCYGCKWICSSEVHDRGLKRHINTMCAKLAYRIHTDS